MGTRTYSRRRADGTRVLTALGRARFYQATGLATDTQGGEGTDTPPTPTQGRTLAFGGNTESLAQARSRLASVQYDRTIPTEEMVLVDADGNVVFQKNDGDTSEVQWRDVDPALLRRTAYVTHNHPVGVTFSRNDIVSMIDAGWQGLEARGKPFNAAEQKVLQQVAQALIDELAPSGKLTADGKKIFTDVPVAERQGAIVDAIKQFAGTLTAQPVGALTYTLHYEGRPNLQVAKRIANQYGATQQAILANTNMRTISSRLVADLMTNQKMSYERASRLVDTMANVVLQHVSLVDSIRGTGLSYQVDFE